MPAPEPEAEEDEEEDPGEALARQLREYKLFKEKAGLLAALEAGGQRGYVRLAPPPQLDKRLDPAGLDVQALWDAVHDVLLELDAPPRPIHAIAPLKVTVEDRMAALRQHLVQHQVIRFRQFLRQGATRTEILVSFLAVLEMIKQRLIRVRQPDAFGEIFIEGMEGSWLLQR